MPDTGDADRNLTAKTGRGMAWLMSGAVVMSIARVITLFVMARLLTPEDFGLMATAGIFIELARLLSESGIVLTLVQRTDLTDGDIRTAFTANMASAVLASVALCIGAGAAADFFAMPWLEPILYVVSLIFPMTAVSSVSTALLDRTYRFGASARAEVIALVVGNLLVGIGLAVAGFGVWALVLSNVAAALVRSILIVRSSPHRLRFGFHLPTYLSLMRTGGGFGLIRLASFVSLKGDYFVVGRILGASLLGQYERAYLLMNISNSLIAGPMSRVLFPAFSRIGDDRERVRSAFLRSTTLISAIFIPASFAAIILAPQIVAVLLGTKWNSAVLPFQILAASMFFRTAYKVTNATLMGSGLVYRSALSQSIYAAAVVGGSLLGVQYGIAGVALATGLAIVVFYFIQLGMVATTIRLRPRDMTDCVAPAAILSGMTVMIIYSATFLADRFVSSPFFTLMLASSMMITGLAIALTLFPQAFGADVRSLILTLTKSVRNRMPNEHPIARWIDRVAGRPS